MLPAETHGRRCRRFGPATVRPYGWSGRLATCARPLSATFCAPGRPARSPPPRLGRSGTPKVPILRTGGLTVRNSGTLGCLRRACCRLDEAKEPIPRSTASRRPAKPPSLRALCPYVRRTGGFSSREPRKPPEVRASGSHARKPGGFVAGPSACTGRGRERLHDEVRTATQGLLVLCRSCQGTSRAARPSHVPPACGHPMMPD